MTAPEELARQTIGKLCESPSSVAKVTLKRGANGWQFWHYKSTQGEWFKLAELKR